MSKIRISPGGLTGQLIRQFEEQTKQVGAVPLAAALQVLHPSPHWAGRNKAMMAGNYADIEKRAPGSIDLPRAVRMAHSRMLGFDGWEKTL